MTKDEVIHIAHVAGVVDFLYSNPDLQDAYEFLQHFADLVVAVEREACAQTCEERNAQGYYIHDTRYDCAEAIRARASND